MTTTLSAPVVTRPRARAPRWPVSPLTGALPSWAPASRSSMSPATPGCRRRHECGPPRPPRAGHGAVDPSTRGHGPGRRADATAQTLVVRPRKFMRSRRGRSLVEGAQVPADQARVAPSAWRATPAGERSGAAGRVRGTAARPGARLSGFMSLMAFMGPGYRCGPGPDVDTPLPSPASGVTSGRDSDAARADRSSNHRFRIGRRSRERPAGQPAASADSLSRSPHAAGRLRAVRDRRARRAQSWRCARRSDGRLALLVYTALDRLLDLAGDVPWVLMDWDGWPSKCRRRALRHDPARHTDSEDQR